MKAIRVHQHGGPEALHHDEVDQPAPRETEVLVRVAAAGVNFLDVYHRSGLYPMKLPLTLGQEGAGVIVDSGERVAWASVPGSYAEYVSAPVDKLVRIPDEVSDATAAAVMLQGMTAHYLATSTFPLKHGDRCLVYAAAGGVGQLLVQIAKLRGAVVIGATSTEEKARLASEAGCDHVILYARQDVATEVRRITGSGVDVVYDAVGKNTWQSSLDALRPRGMLVSFGNASGPVGQIDPLILSRKGSLFLTRPTLVNYTATRDELEQRAGDLFNWLRAGQLHVRIDRELPLAQAAEAHRALEGRATAGKVLLRP